MPTIISVIIEWENAKLSELERAESMLTQLGVQMRQLADKRDITAELIVLYDDEEIDVAVPRHAVDKAIDAASWPGTIRFAPAPGQRYYEQKNTGAGLSTGAILVFLDSDVVPDEGWLEGLISALDDPAVKVVGGETYHATDTPYYRLFAAFWSFAPRRPSQGVYGYKNFYANNFAVRREVFLANKFPDAIAYRGQCTELAKSLRKNGFTIYRQGASTVSHPPPMGLRTFVIRAVCQGYDTIYWKARRKRFGRLISANPLASLVRWIRHLVRVVSNVVTRARSVGLGPLGALTAIGAGFAFFTCKFVGEIVSFFAPGLIRNNLSV